MLDSPLIPPSTYPKSRSQLQTCLNIVSHKNGSLFWSDSIPRCSVFTTNTLPAELSGYYNCSLSNGVSTMRFKNPPILLRLALEIVLYFYLHYYHSRLCYLSPSESVYCLYSQQHGSRDFVRKLICYLLCMFRRLNFAPRLFSRGKT